MIGGFGFDQLEDSNVIDMEVSQGLVGISMDISTGLGLGTDSEIEFMSAAEIERVWGVYLKKVTFGAGLNYKGSLQGFSSLEDVVHVLDSKSTATLNDDSQKEDAVIFALKDGRTAFVWIAHCDSGKCCGCCVYSTLGLMSASEQDIRYSLPEQFKQYFGGLRKSSAQM